MGCGWGLDASAHPSATLNALWDFFSSPRVSELSLDSLRARDWELSQDLRAIFGLSESCKTLCKLDSSQRVWELFLLSEIVKALTAFRELYLNLEIISCLQESLVIVFHLEHATYELAASVCPSVCWYPLLSRSFGSYCLPAYSSATGWIIQPFLNLVYGCTFKWLIRLQKTPKTRKKTRPLESPLKFLTFGSYLLFLFSF